MGANRGIEEIGGIEMPKIFWVTCPRCGGKFYARYDDFRHKKRELACPHCTAKFLDEEAKEIEE